MYWDLGGCAGHIHSRQCTSPPYTSLHVPTRLPLHGKISEPLCQQLWSTTTSFLLPKSTLKLHAHFLVLLLRLAVTGLSWRFYTRKPHTAPSFYPGVHIPVYVSFLRVPRYRSSTDVSCLGYVIRIRVCLPPLISCRLYISSMRSKYYVFAFFDG